MRSPHTGAIFSSKPAACTTVRPRNAGLVAVSTQVLLILYCCFCEHLTTGNPRHKHKATNVSVKDGHTKICSSITRLQTLKMQVLRTCLSV